MVGNSASSAALTGWGLFFLLVPRRDVERPHIGSPANAYARCRTSYKYFWNPTNKSRICSELPKSATASPIALYLSFSNAESLSWSSSRTPTFSYYESTKSRNACCLSLKFACTCLASAAGTLATRDGNSKGSIVSQPEVALPW